jgi:hypothetical protein
MKMIPLTFGTKGLEIQKTDFQIKGSIEILRKS